MPELIAVTGATGNVGSRIARALASQGAAVRLVLRDPARAPQGFSDLAVIDDYLDSPGLRSGLAGCDTLFLASARESANRIAEHRSVIDAAVQSGVRRVVYLSYQAAAEECVFTFGRDHWHTEQAIRAAPLEFVFLRDSFYLAMIPALCGGDGVIRGPAGQGRVAAVSHDDVAAVAAAVLVRPDLVDATFDVTGPEAFTLAEAAARLTRVTGRRVSFVDETEDEAYASRSGFGAPDFEVAGWVTSYQSIAAGEVAGVSDTVQTLTGRRPQDLDGYLRSHPETWTHLLG